MTAGIDSERPKKSAAPLATKSNRRQGWIDRSGAASEPTSECP
jgi:hypothetical protein